MALDHQTTLKPPPQTPLVTTFQHHARRRTFYLRRRENNKHLPTVRLGGNKPRRGLFIVRTLKKLRLRWLKLQYTCMLRKLRKYYKNLIKDIVEAAATVEAIQRPMFTESTFDVSVMGASWSTFTSATRPDPRPLLLVTKRR
ncbi:hypothetical protein PTKIN_Ptkin18bG0079300 [Pterospermum kingtungense]